LNNGTFARYTDERIINFDPVSTDWCKKIPKYSYTESLVLYLGAHDYVPENTSISYSTARKECGDPWGLCGFASRPGSIKYSCNTLFITVDRLMLDFTKETRMYRRLGGNPKDYLRWTD
jgi:hypothetical protein